MTEKHTRQQLHPDMIISTLIGGDLNCANPQAVGSRAERSNANPDFRPSGVDLNHTHLKIMTAAAGLEEVVAGDDQAVQFTYATSYTPTINGVRTPFKIQSLLDKFAVDENSRAHVTLSTYPLTKEKLNALRIKPDHALLSILFGR